MGEQYELLPPLTAAEREALRASIIDTTLTSERWRRFCGGEPLDENH